MLYDIGTAILKKVTFAYPNLNLRVIIVNLVYEFGEELLSSLAHRIR